MKLLKMLLSGFLLMAGLWLLLFVPAGTLDHWKAWLFFAVIITSSWISSLYLMRTSPAVLERRMLATETRPAQKFLAGTNYFFWLALVVVSALDHRFGWSPVPTHMSMVGFSLILFSIVGITLVCAQNAHAATTIRVEPNQALISTGIYGRVRHPMYTFVTCLYFGTPLALGSYWGLAFTIPAILIFALRIRDEEKLLEEELLGYRDYMRKVPHRLVPGVW